MNKTRKVIAGAAVVGASLVGGALGASFVNGTASAQTDSSSSSSTAPADVPTTPPADGHGGRCGPHMANGITEAVLTGDAADKVTAAAQSAVPGATIDRVETDADGDTYEAHVTKSDGSKATVKLDADFNVTSVQDGMR